MCPGVVELAALADDDWTGTNDPTAYLSIPKAIEFMESLLPGGWEDLREHNRILALEGRRILCDTLEIDQPCPDSMIGSMATIMIPDGPPDQPSGWPHVDPLQLKLYDTYKIEVPVSCWPHPPKRVLRISAQIYNSPDQYRYLATALADLLQ